MIDRPDLGKVESVKLSRLFELQEIDAEFWSDDDLPAIFQHQLSAPLLPDLAHIDPTLPSTLEAQQSNEPLTSFGDLLEHSEPPLVALECVKEFAKRRGLPGNATQLPRDIGAGLYLLAISAALVRAGTRISSHSNESLRDRLHWATLQPWIGEHGLDLLSKAQKLVENDG